MSDFPVHLRNTLRSKIDFIIPTKYVDNMKP